MIRQPGQTEDEAGEEDPASFRFAGCQQGQGFLFSAPMTAAELAAATAGNAAGLRLVS